MEAGFPTGVENMEGGGLFKVWWEGLKPIHGGHIGGGGAKMLSKTTCEVHLIVKMLAISLQTCKFTKNELLRKYFWRILGIIIISYYLLCFS